MLAQLTVLSLSIVAGHLTLHMSLYQPFRITTAPQPVTPDTWV